MRIVWLASYPKSGNTWVRYFLYSYLVGPVASTAHLARRIPDVHVPGHVEAAEPIDGRLLVKTHFAWSDAHPYSLHTEGFIYILRHPKDALLSNLHYRRLVARSAESMAMINDRAYAATFLRERGDPVWRGKGFGTWAEHAASWLSKPATPHLVLKYEDLRADPLTHFRRAVEFLKVPVDEARLAEAVKASSFDQMRAMEIRAKRGAAGDIVFNGYSKYVPKGMFFMNKGAVGQSLASIDPAFDAVFDRQFGHDLERFGYTPHG